MILITGSRGFLGSKLHEKIGGLGIDLRDGLNILTCDLHDADVIYHLAAQSDVEPSWHDPVHDASNYTMMVRLVHWYPKAKIIYTQSAASIDKSSPYGFSKWAAGEYLKKFHSNYVICTLPNIYGEGSRSVVDKFKGKDTVIIYGDGTHTRDYVHVLDIVQGLIMAKDWKVGEYQMGSGIATSVLELAGTKRKIFQESRKESESSVLKNTCPNWFPTHSVKDYVD